MGKEKDLFKIAQKVVPFATIASLSIVATTFCKGKCDNAITSLTGSSVMFLACVIFGSLYLLTDKDFFYFILYMTFLLGILSLGVSVYQIYQVTKS